MPRWLLLALLAACLLWLAGVGLLAFGDDGDEPAPEDASRAAERWFGGLASLLPAPAALRRADVELQGPCGAFPELELEGKRACRVVVVPERGRRAARLHLVRGRVALRVELPRGEPVERELDSESDAQLRFDDDGGAFSARCLGSGGCAVRLLE